MPDTLNHEMFSKYLNTTFHVFLADSKTVATELIKVSELQTSPHQERFAIVFRGPREPLLNQGIYHFEHADMGEFELFIVPLQQDDNGTLYEAIFNRIRKGD